MVWGRNLGDHKTSNSVPSLLWSATFSPSLASWELRRNDLSYAGWELFWTEIDVTSWCSQCIWRDSSPFCKSIWPRFPPGFSRMFCDGCAHVANWGRANWHWAAQVVLQGRDQPKRRTDLCVTRASADGTTTLCDFPSWSWVGSVGKVYWTHAFTWKHNLESSEWTLKFYYLDGNGLRTSAQETRCSYEKTNILSQTCLLTPDKRTAVTLEDIPEILRRLFHRFKHIILLEQHCKIGRPARKERW